MQHLHFLFEEIVQDWCIRKVGMPVGEVVIAGTSILIKCPLSVQDRPISVLFEPDDFSDLDPQTITEVVTFRLDLEFDVRSGAR